MGSVSTMRGKPAYKQAQTLNNVMGSIVGKATGGSLVGSGGGGGGVQTAAQNVQTAPQQYSYGGINMTQDEAQKKYQDDLAAWRAPTTTGKAPSATPVPTTPTSAFGSDGGPALPKFGVLPSAPVVVPRQQLAQQIFYGGYSKNHPGGR